MDDMGIGKQVMEDGTHTKSSNLDTHDSYKLENGNVLGNLDMDLQTDRLLVIITRDISIYSLSELHS